MYRPRDLEGLFKIFTFDKKRDLERYCRDVVVYGSDFAAFIRACNGSEALPFFHRIYYHDIVPEHLVPTDAGRAAIAANGVGLLKPEARKAVRKVFQLFEDRRWLVGHMFYTESLYEWHFFCFDQRDTEASRRNHWKNGAHMHFVNWLWPNYGARLVWSAFAANNVTPGGSVHIRYNDFLLDDDPLVTHDGGGTNTDSSMV